MLLIVNDSNELNGQSTVLDNQLIECLKVEIEKLKSDLKEKNDLYLYTRAEVENLGKKHVSENERCKKTVLEKFTNELFLLADTIEYGLCFEKLQNQQDTRNFDFFVGFRLIYEMLLTIFEKNEISQMNPINSEFDPKKHEVVMLKNLSNLTEKNVILEVIQRGYVFKNFVLRHAKVVISS